MVSIRSCATHRPQGAFVHSDRAKVLTEVGDYDEAVRAADEAIRLDRFQAVPYMDKAIALLRAGRPAAADDAISDFDEMLQLSESPSARCGRMLLEGERQLHSGRPAEALAATDRFTASECLWNWGLTHHPHLRGRVFAAMGDRSAAIAAYREMLGPSRSREGLAIGPHIVALYELALLEDEAGDRASAREHYTLFLDHWGDADHPLTQVADAKERLAALQ